MAEPASNVRKIPDYRLQALAAFSLGQSVRVLTDDGRTLDYEPDRAGMCDSMLTNHPTWTASGIGDVAETVRTGREVPRVFRTANGDVKRDGGAPLDKVLNALQAVGRVTRKGRQYRTKCPYHGGKTLASLSVTETADGTALIYCFSGCAADDILGAVGLTLADLFMPVADKDRQKEESEAIAALIGGRPLLRVLPDSLIRLAEVEPETVDWLWRGYIPLGKITMLEGDPGLGKSMLTLSLAGTVTGTNKWLPDGSLTEVDGGVVIVSLEDGLGDTIRPRLDAIEGADLTRIYSLAEVDDGQGGKRPISLPDDLGQIRAAIKKVNAKLVILDPLSAMLDAKHNINSDQDVRRALAPLAILASDTGCAILILRHLGKQGQRSAVYRGAGSIGVIGAARAGLLVAKSPDDPDHERIFSQTKSNLGRPMPSLSYRIKESIENGVGYVVWGGESDYSADQLVNQRADEAPALAEAVAFLRSLLADGPVAADQGQEAAKEVGIAPATLKRARRRLGVHAARIGGLGTVGAWVWSLPIRRVEAADPGTTEIEF